LIVELARLNQAGDECPLFFRQGVSRGKVLDN